MVAIQHLLAPSTLAPSTATSLSCVSWNVLLPNSVDGWWTYKMYSPPLDSSTKYMGEWEHRSSLIKERVQQLDADVVCFQEVSPKSFESDFAFMSDELGYDGVELFRKGRFRPATFWRKDRIDLVAPPVHKDRCLLTTFRHVENAQSSEDGVNWHVLNCHLQAGKQGGRRLRQIHEGCNAAVNLARKLKERDPMSPMLVVCGDFNGGPECGAVRYLEDGLVGPDFLEDGESVTSKIKSMTLSHPLTDVANAPELSRGQAPSTLVVSELISQLIKEGTENDIELSDAVIDRLDRIYQGYASHTSNDGGHRVMGRVDVERWLTDINGQVGRGSEFRRAAREMGYVDPPPTATESEPSEKPRIYLPDGILSPEGFREVYAAELKEGKFWGVHYDLSIMGEPLPDAGTFTARYDRIYCSKSILPTAVLDTVCLVPCPNTKEPSDHLPVAARFEVNV